MSGFQFGTPATTGGASSNAPAGSLFGQPTAGSTGGGIFGNVGGQAAANKPAGGAAAPTSSLFGQTPTTSPTFALNTGQNNPSPFGMTPNKPEAGQQKLGGHWGDSGKPSLFGSTTPAPATGGLFGAGSTTPAGLPPASSTGGQATSLFSQPAQSAGTGTSLFGAKPATTTAAEPATSGTSNLFGGAPKPMGSPAFGQNNLFGALGGDKQATTAQPSKAEGKPTGILGAASQASPSLFPAPTASPEKSTASPFGFPPATSSNAAPTTTSASGGLFGTPKPSTSGEATSATPASTAQTSAPSMFSLAKPAATTAPESTQAAASTAAPAPTTTSSPFGAPAAATSGPCGTAGAASNINAALGASTAGPAPPAQSRLKNKTMDEIITRWATDLTKYQKEFQEQAEQVAEWDRMLVENGSKVQKLYGNTIDAERATQEVERQLAVVEGQQDELSTWLDRYEQEVETLLSKQVGAGESLQGPDQERERTYKLAERLSERLNDMGQDLTTMIDEVNSASANLSKTAKADEPVSQIVRILNSHLSQLQLIDQGTATLRAKITAAQKAGGSIGGRMSQYGGPSGTPGSVGGGAAEDFYRAYMGRR